MKKVLPLICLLFLTGTYIVIAQNDVTPHQPTYQEIKEAGLSKNYTPEQLTELQAKEALPMQTRIDQLNSEKNIDPGDPTIQTSSNAFAITPANPSICSGQSVALTASNAFTSSSTGLYIADDMWSSVINLPFSFTFYGINYNNIIISTNGSMGFNIANANWFASWWTWITSQPTVFPYDEKNTINGPWIDLYIPAGGTMRYATVGTAPNRIFVSEYCNVNYWGCFSSPSSTFTGQTLLYEGSNIIETHIFNKPLWSCVYFWPVDYAIHSTQNSAGSVAAVVPGRNATNQGWTAFNEGKRWTWNSNTSNYDITNISFAPVGITSPSAITWYDASNNVIGTGATYTIPSSLSAGTYVYHAQVSTSWCSGTISYTAYDTLTVTNSLAAPVASPVTICPNTTASLSGSCGGNCLWYTSSSGGTPIGTGYYTTPILSSSTTYYVGYSSGACVSPRTAVSVTVGSTLATPTASATSVCNSSTASTLTGNCGSNCLWYNDTTLGAIGAGSTYTTVPPTTTYYVRTLNGMGCTSAFSPVTVPVTGLNVTASTSLTNCPPSSGNLVSVYTGAAASNSTVSNTTLGSAIPNQTSSNYCATSDPSDAVNCPSAAWKTRTVTAPAGVSNPMTSTSIVSVYFKLQDASLLNYLGNPTAVGADPKVWLKSPSGTYLLLTSPRSFNTNYATSSGNYCYCPTFTPAGTDGLIPNYDTAYNWMNYMPEGGALGSAFVGQNPAGIWTLYVNDNVDTGGQSFGGLKIKEFDMTFLAYPTPAYSWSLQSSSGSCGSLSSTTISGPTYTPPSPYTNSYSCTYQVTVTSGSCTGTQTITIGCASLPVELLSYTGKNTSNGDELKWTTATETNNSYFTIERFREGQAVDAHWKIPSRAIDGNSTSSINYYLTDKDIKPGVYYYSLSQTDIDGATKINGTVAITVKGDRDVISVVPNPTKGTAEITYDCNSNEAAFLKLYDHSGSLVMMREISCAKGENKYTIDLSGNPDGIYLITIATSDNVYKARLIKAM